MASNSLPQQFTALGDKTRYAIVVSTLKGESLCCSELAKKLGMTPAAISQHVKLLEQAGVIVPGRTGRRMCYELNPASEQAQALAKLIKQEERI